MASKKPTARQIGLHRRRTNRTHNTRAYFPEWGEAFLAALSESANVRLSCIAAGVARSTAYEVRRESPEFSKRWDEAIATAIDTLEQEAWRRAREGVRRVKSISVGSGKNRTYKEVEERDYSDALLMFLLRAHRPFYRDNFRTADDEHENPLISVMRQLATQAEKLNANGQAKKTGRRKSKG